MGDIELQIFSERLKELRTSLKLTQAQFVEELGITASALSAYEKNLKNPSISVAKRIAEKFHVSIDWLCGLTDKKYPTNEIQTYGDIINAFFLIDQYVDIILKSDIETIYTGMLFSDKLIDTFLREWLEATNVRDNTTINREITKTMYDSWKKSKLEELNAKKLKKKRR